MIGNFMTHHSTNRWDARTICKLVFNQIAYDRFQCCHIYTAHVCAACTLDVRKYLRNIIRIKGDPGHCLSHVSLSISFSLLWFFLYLPSFSLFLVIIANPIEKQTTWMQKIVFIYTVLNNVRCKIYTYVLFLLRVVFSLNFSVI